ncbi:PEP/pyruvate-binding domain-containing protein [Streptomyces sp. 4N509B]|uniref:PEP/pyruvate-binding domain-containing protein n=1 Tax=Streptomyces sp. 4N509B TaxID=3457413 RepID=UPI003FD0E4D1
MGADAGQDVERLLARLAVVPLAGGAPAADAAVTGAKAARLARAHATGLPALPGFVLVPADRAPGLPVGREPLRRAWQELTRAHSGADGAVVVRSSSPAEDSETSALAGRFASVLDVRGFEAVASAVGTVLDSVHRVPGADRAGMAVLVQPMVRAVAGGVMFGADPLAGREDRVLVSAVAGGPDRLVGGRAPGVRYQLTRWGRLVRADPAERRSSRVLSRRRLARLARLARRTGQVFGGPQDVEFAFDAEDRLWLFQSRPITAMAAPTPRGARLLGPGPVAETFPHVLQPLEEELWLTPMARGLAFALDLAGAAPRRVLRAVPTVSTVNGRAVADLRLLGAVPASHPVLSFINPLPGARRASAAWRMGRLRAALPLLAVDLMADVDRELAGLPPPETLPRAQLLAALGWGREVLVSLHAQESLAGALLSPGRNRGASAVGEALAVLATARRSEAGAADEERLLSRHPVLLVLLPPALDARASGRGGQDGGDGHDGGDGGDGRSGLPTSLGWTGEPRGLSSLSVREGLRLRIRWVQEMQVRLVRATADRLAAEGWPDALARLSTLRWPELVAVLEGASPPPDLDRRRPRPDSPRLPAAFRLAADGGVVTERPPGRAPADDGGGHGSRGRERVEGQGAGGGFGSGTAWHGSGGRPREAVLVVPTLDPELAPLLPGLAGLVAETGSVLSHLAILAREYRVPTAVAVAGAVERFPEGARLSVDGTTGAVWTSPADPHGADPEGARSVA